MCQHTHTLRERKPSRVPLKETSIFVPVSGRACGIDSPLETCDLEDEESVEEKRGGGGSGTEKGRAVQKC